MRQLDSPVTVITPGTLMHKAIPPRLVEPYLTGQRPVIAGFVYRAADTSFTRPADYYQALDLGYPGSEFSSSMTEIYVLQWQAGDPASYQVPYSPGHGGDWTDKPPFTGTGYTSAASPVAEFFTDPVPLPAGAEIYRVSDGRADFVAGYDGFAWRRQEEV